MMRGVLLALLGFVLMAGLLGAAPANGGEMAAVPTSTRPAPQPLPSATNEAEDPVAVPSSEGASIVLEVTFAPEADWTGFSWQELWTVVQWQDAQGAWHDVEGWQGTLDEVEGGVGWKRWWVFEDNFGEGPFRWVLYQVQDGLSMAESPAFDLPARIAETIRVEVTVAP